MNQEAPLGESIKLQQAGPFGSFADSATAQQKSEELIAEASYRRLKALVGSKVTAAIQSGKLLFQEKPSEVSGSFGSMFIYGPVQLSHWHAHLPESQRQHYKCDYCNQVWMTLAGFAVMDENGMLSYPAAEAFIEMADDPVMDYLFQRYPQLLKVTQATQRRPAKLLPIAQLRPYLAERVVGGFEHFYGVKDDAVLKKWNDEHHAMLDGVYVQELFKKFLSREIDVDFLQKLFIYVKKQIGEMEHTAISRANDLVQLIRDIRRVNDMSSQGMMYLWGLLHDKKNSWMLHINGSVLGIVLDTAEELKEKDDLEMGLMRVKRLLANATAGENYKQKTAEAPQAALTQAYNFLKDNNLLRTMERKLLPIHEVKSVVWYESDSIAPAAGTQPAATAAEAAFQALTAKKSPGVQVNKKMDDILGDIVTEERMSMFAFLEKLSEYAELSVSPQTPQLNVVIATGAVAEGAHDTLLTFDKEVSDYASLVGTPQPYAYGQIAGMLREDGGKSYFQPQPLPVRAVFRTNRLAREDVATSVLHIVGFAQRFQKQIPQHGTCVLGSMIKSEHFGMSRSIVEISQQIPMNVEAGEHAAGGVFVAPGLVLEALRKDGTRAKIFLTSVK